MHKVSAEGILLLNWEGKSWDIRREEGGEKEKKIFKMGSWQ